MAKRTEIRDARLRAYAESVRPRRFFTKKRLAWIEHRKTLKLQ